MRNTRKHFPVNWIDGMKINKNHLVEQDNASIDALQEIATLGLSPLKFGILPPSSAGEDTYDVKISFDNQETFRVSVISCQAITSGGVRISLPSVSPIGETNTGNILTATIPFSPSGGETVWWIFLSVHPFEKQPAGNPDLAENPPRFPIVLPTYNIRVVSGNNYREYSNHPFAIAIGKVSGNGKDIKIEDDYIPPCLAINSHPDLVSLHGELDEYLADLELHCSQIIQNIFRKNQQNEISELVMFLCDRVMLYLSQIITSMRWTMIYEPPVCMFSGIATLARVLKNSIDFRVGSGKEELMNYLCEWCELKQGQLESLLSTLANNPFNHNDINKSIQEVVSFVKITSRLFDTLSKLEFIGKRKESHIFVKEESSQETAQNKARRRFLG